MKDINNELYKASTAERIATLLVACVAGVSIFAMPFIFGALLDSKSLDVSRATYATSAEISMIALGSVFVSFALRKLSPKSTVIFATLLVCIGQTTTLWGDGYTSLLISRAVVGIGEGLCMGIGFAALSAMVNGTRLLSYCTGIVAVLSLIAFQTAPHLKEYIGSAAIIWILLVFGIITALLSPLVPNFKSEAGTSLTLGPLFTLPGFCLFLTGVMVSAGSNTLWLYFEQVGLAAGMSESGVATLGSLSTLPILIVPFVSNFIFGRIKSVIPLAITCVLSAVLSYFYISTKSTLVFGVVVLLMTFLYMFLIGYIRMYSAHIDHSGRTTAAIGGSDSLGMVIGPLLASALLNLSGAYQSLGTFGILMQVGCIVPCFLILASSAKSQSPLSAKVN